MDNQEIKNDAALAETLEVAAPEQVITPEPVQQENVEIPPVETAAPVEDGNSLRFKTLRQARERAERERDELKLRMAEIEAAQRQPVAPVPASEEYSLAPDDLVEGKHLNREIKKLREELNSYRQQSTEIAVEAKLKAKYSDFESIVSKENLEILNSVYPEIVATLNASPDLYNKAVSAYTMIKQFGIATDQVYDKQKARAHENAAKPRPIASVNAQPGSDSPLSRANAFAEGLTPDIKRDLYREMLEARKRR